MRKLSVIMILLLVLCTGGVIYVQDEIKSQADEVNYRESVSIGDRQAVNGVVVTSHISYDSHIFWDTICRIDEELTTDTNHKFSVAEEPRNNIRVVDKMDFGGDYSTYINQSADASELTGVDAEYRRIYDAAASGIDQSIVLRLADYHEYYPTSGTVTLGGRYTFSWSSRAGEEYYASGNAGNQAKLISDYFRLRVIDEEKMELHVSRTSNSVSMGSDLVGEDSFTLVTQSISAGDAFYLTFDCHTREGRLVDTSSLRDGYGVYRLPYRLEESGEITLMAEDISMVYPLNEEGYLRMLTTDEQTTKLIVMTEEGDSSIIYVIDIATQELLQKLIIENETDAYLYVEDHFLVMYFSDYNIAVLPEDDNGKYYLEFIAPSDEEDSKYSHFKAYEDMDWNGERLIVTGEKVNFSEGGCCGFFLMAYDKTGMIYYGEYDSTLNEISGMNQYSHTSYFYK